MSVKKFSLKLALFFCFCHASQTLLASENKDIYPSDWSSATHFGYVRQSDSSTGFSGTGGSAVGFSALRSEVFENTGVGLRTYATSANAWKSEFYRLSSLLEMKLALGQRWSIRSGFGFFKEAGKIHDHQDWNYRSKGTLLEFGWDRKVVFTPRFSFSIGGFLQQHRGNIDFEKTAARTNLNSENKSLTIGKNHGYSQGLELSMAFFL